MKSLPYSFITYHGVSRDRGRLDTQVLESQAATRALFFQRRCGRTMQSLLQLKVCYDQLRLIASFCSAPEICIPRL